MKFVNVLLMFFGYTLVYAAVAAGGKFATEPWACLFADAYTESTDPKDSAKPGQQPAPKRIRPGTELVPGQPRTTLIPGTPGSGRGRTPAVPGGRG